MTAPICPHCGASQRSRGYKSKLAAGHLAIFLGGFGIHRFYLGQWWGVFYLLLFWTMLPGLISLIEGIVFLLTNQESWDKRHNDGKPNLGGEGSVGLVIALVAAVFIGIMTIGILAAIAIPAYQDYPIRAKVAGAEATVRGSRGLSNSTSSTKGRIRAVTPMWALRRLPGTMGQSPFSFRKAEKSS